MIFGTGIAMLTSVFPAAEERGRVIGINTASVYTGLSVGPVVGGFLTEHFGWRSIFFLNAFIGLVIIATVMWKLKAEWADAKEKVLTISVPSSTAWRWWSTIYGFSIIPDLTGAWLILIGIIALGLFIRWELRFKFPVLNVGILSRNRVFAFSNLAALINYSATFAVGFLLSLYLQYIKGFTPEKAGLVLVVQPVMMVICSLIAGNLSDRVEPRVLASVGMGLTTLGLAFLLVTLVILGIGFGFFSSPNTNAIMSSVERKSYGVASGMLGTMRLLGQTFSLGLALLLFSLFIGRVQITPDSYPLFLTSMRIAFTISAALCLAGVFASAIRVKRLSSKVRQTGPVRYQRASERLPSLTPAGLPGSPGQTP